MKKSFYLPFLSVLLTVICMLVGWSIWRRSPLVLAQMGSLVPLNHVKQVVAGGSHTCALTSTGGVKCWGWNYYGQLGDGTQGDQNTPVAVNGLTNGVTSISLGGSYYDGHTCALTITGGVKCWGRNAYGQLGDGTLIDKSAPVDVNGLTNGIIAISTGGDHTCALTITGGVKCWGRNAYGQLGDGTLVDKSAPVSVSGLDSGIAAIAAGRAHTCALTTTGGVKCWGRNAYGQLGNGVQSDRNTPSSVSGLSSDVTAITASGDHTCALTSAGGVKCWGYNDYGELGNGTWNAQNTPVNVISLNSGVTAIAAGGYHTCALTSAGAVKCWGWNAYGQLGDDSRGSKNIPVAVSGLTSGVAAIAAGYDHACALTTTGGVKCWGRNAYGQLGDGTQGNKNTASTVNGLTNSVTAIAASNYHSCALTTAGGVQCWGANYYGQLGGGTGFSEKTPVDVSGLSSGVAAITAGGGYDDGGHTCALTTAGGVKCWGWNAYGQLGSTHGDSYTPVDVSGLSSGVAAIAAGGYHTCALTTAGGVKCWGWNASGQLGAEVYQGMLVDVSGLSGGVAAIATGDAHTCALTTAGGVQCWGANGSGQLGDGTQVTKTTPVNVNGLSSGVIVIATGFMHTCALTTAGGVQCWGANGSGQLGDGTQVTKTTPVNVNGLSSGVIAITTGFMHTCALTAAGGVQCWGANSSGQLGDGTQGAKTAPVNVNGLSSGVIAIAAGGYHTCALTAAGNVQCWGANGSGQLGDGSAWRTTPEDVMEVTSGTPTATPTNTPTQTATPTPILTPTSTATSLPAATPTLITARVEGKVVDKETQKGVPGVLMSLTSINASAVSASVLVANDFYTTTTDLDGAYVFSAIKLGTYTLTGTKEGKMIQSLAPLVLNTGETVQVPSLQSTQTKPTIYLPLVIR